MDYSKPHAPGTPTWLKLTRDGEQPLEGIEKENARPAGHEHKGKKASVGENPAAEKVQDGDKKRPALKEGGATGKPTSRKSGLAAQDVRKAADDDNNALSKEDAGKKGLPESKAIEEDFKARGRKSAPAAGSKPAKIEEQKRRSAPEKLPTKRRPSDNTDGKEQKGRSNKKAKPSPATEQPAIAKESKKAAEVLDGVKEPSTRTSDSWRTTSEAGKQKDAKSQGTGKTQRVAQSKAAQSAQPAEEKAASEQPKAKKKSTVAPTAPSSAAQEAEPTAATMQVNIPHQQQDTDGASNFVKLQVHAHHCLSLLRDQNRYCRPYLPYLPCISARYVVILHHGRG